MSDNIIQHPSSALFADKIKREERNATEKQNRAPARSVSL
jgi:hypothetical protein